MLFTSALIFLLSSKIACYVITLCVYPLAHAYTQFKQKLCSFNASLIHIVIQAVKRHKALKRNCFNEANYLLHFPTSLSLHYNSLIHCQPLGPYQPPKGVARHIKLAIGFCSHKLLPSYPHTTRDIYC